MMDMSSGTTNKRASPLDFILRLIVRISFHRNKIEKLIIKIVVFHLTTAIILYAYTSMHVIFHHVIGVLFGEPLIVRVVPVILSLPPYLHLYILDYVALPTWISKGLVTAVLMGPLGTIFASILIAAIAENLLEGKTARRLARALLIYSLIEGVLFLIPAMLRSPLRGEPLLNMGYNDGALVAISLGVSSRNVFTFIGINPVSLFVKRYKMLIDYLLLLYLGVHVASKS